MLFTDKPTGSLRAEDSVRIMKPFTEFVADGTTVVMVSQDDTMADYADHVLHLAHGSLRDTDDLRPACRAVPAAPQAESLRALVP